MRCSLAKLDPVWEYGMMLCGYGGHPHGCFVGLHRKEEGNKSMLRAMVVRRTEVSSRYTRTVTPEPKEKVCQLWEIKYT